MPKYLPAELWNSWSYEERYDLSKLWYQSPDLDRTVRVTSIKGNYYMYFDPHRAANLVKLYPDIYSFNMIHGCRKPKEDDV